MRVAVIGAGAMGAALAILHSRAGCAPALLGTRLDERAITACEAGDPHPALGVTLPDDVFCRRHAVWPAVLRDADVIVLAVSSDGLGDVVGDVREHARHDAIWVIATKGWDPSTLRTPSEVVGSARSVVLAGPALAPEVAVGAPAALVGASHDVEAGSAVASTFSAGGVAMSVTDDIVGTEVSSAYKNVAAIAVGICEGLRERESERVVKHTWANARATLFAQGLRDMLTLAAPRGGRAETVLGPAGAGDLYVTCLGGRNGALGRLLGAGQTTAQAQATIGSTVEGVPNTTAALALAQRESVDLPVARLVAAVLSGKTPATDAITEAVRAAGSAS